MPTPCSVSPLMRVCGVHLCMPAGDHARESMYAACMCVRLGTAVRVCACVHDLPSNHGMCVCMVGCRRLQQDACAHSVSCQHLTWCSTWHVDTHTCTQAALTFAAATMPAGPAGRQGSRPSRQATIDVEYA